MLPDEFQRIVTFNRTDRLKYVEWMCEKTGVLFKAEMMHYRNRIQIDEVFMKYLPEDIEPEIVDLPVLPEPEVIQISRPKTRMSRLSEFQEEAKEEAPNWVESALEVEGVEEIVEEPTELDTEDGDSENSDLGIDESPVDNIQEEIIPPSQTIEANMMFQSNDYNSWTVVELREECRKRNITIRGTKAEVVLRLRQDDEGPQSNQNNVTEAPVTPVTAVEETLDAPVDTAATEVEKDANSG
tara:strand:+ start:486 stop:1208 length:723 start_codon:yes stop_codon:yes gene_type:complete